MVGMYNKALASLLKEFIDKGTEIHKVSDITLCISYYLECRQDMNLAKEKYSDRPDILEWHEKKVSVAKATLERVLAENNIESVSMSDI